MLQEPLPTGAAASSRLREVGWPFVGSPGGGMWFLPQVPVVPAPHLGSTPKLAPSPGLSIQGRGCPSLDCWSPSPESMPIIQGRKKPPLTGGRGKAFGAWQRGRAREAAAPIHSLSRGGVLGPCHFFLIATPFRVLPKSVMDGLWGRSPHLCIPV